MLTSAGTHSERVFTWRGVGEALAIWRAGPSGRTTQAKLGHEIHTFFG